MVAPNGISEHEELFIVSAWQQCWPTRILKVCSQATEWLIIVSSLWGSLLIKFRLTAGLFFVCPFWLTAQVKCLRSPHTRWAQSIMAFFSECKIVQNCTLPKWTKWPPRGERTMYVCWAGFRFADATGTKAVKIQSSYLCYKIINLFTTFLIWI